MAVFTKRAWGVRRRGVEGDEPQPALDDRLDAVEHEAARCEFDEPLARLPRGAGLKVLARRSDTRAEGAGVGAAQARRGVGDLAGHGAGGDGAPGLGPRAP